MTYKDRFLYKKYIIKIDVKLIYLDTQKTLLFIIILKIKNNPQYSEQINELLEINYST